MTDSDLLRSYVDDGSEAAFAELVERHLNLVYSVARRHVQSSSLAEDVAQSVFIELARHARRIKADTPLIAWLHIVSRRVALNAVRSEARRQARDAAAATLDAMKPTPSLWADVEPLLDEAVETLDATDRSAILLRFFENKSLREVGAALGTSEDTAQKRVSRAVDQLRTFFLRRGIAVTAAGLATDLSAHALHLAPTGLGASIAAASIVQPAVASAAATLTMTAFHKAILGAGLIAVVGGAVFEGNALLAQRAEFAATRQRTDVLLIQERDIRQQRADALQRLKKAQQRLAALAASAKSPVDIATESEIGAWLDRVARLKALRDQRPDLVIPELSLLADESWFQSARDLHLETEEQVRDAFAGLRNRAERAFNDYLHYALGAYLDTHNRTLPDDSHELAPFFRPPVDPALLDRYKMAAQGKVAADRSVTLIEQHSPLDFSRDMVWNISIDSGMPRPALSSYVSKAIQAFTQANNGAMPTLPEQLQPYLPAPVDPAKLQRYLNPRR